MGGRDEDSKSVLGNLPNLLSLRCSQLMLRLRNVTKVIVGLFIVTQVDVL